MEFSVASSGMIDDTGLVTETGNPGDSRLQLLIRTIRLGTGVSGASTPSAPVTMPNIAITQRLAPGWIPLTQQGEGTWSI